MQWMASFAITHHRPFHFRRTSYGAPTDTYTDATQADQPDMASHYGYWQKTAMRHSGGERSLDGRSTTLLADQSSSLRWLEPTLQ